MAALAAAMPPSLFYPHRTVKPLASAMGIEGAPPAGGTRLICSTFHATMSYMKENKKPTSIRLSPEGKRLRKVLAGRLGLSESAVIELALRRLAEMEGVKRES